LAGSGKKKNRGGGQKGFGRGTGERKSRASSSPVARMGNKKFEGMRDGSNSHFRKSREKILSISEKSKKEKK